MLLSIISLISPIMGIFIILCIVIKNWNKTEHNNLKVYIFPLAMIFGMIGYSMTIQKHSGTDLSNYFDLLDSLKFKSLSAIFLSDMEKLYTKDILFYFVNLTENNHILPFIVGITAYSIVFYVLFDRIMNSNEKFKTYEILILSVICTGIIGPYFIICNVRCVLSYCIITLAIYREIYQKKKNIITILLYILPLGLHSSSIVILVIRLLSTYVKRFSKIMTFIPILLPNIISFAYENIGSIGIKIIDKAISKAYIYLNWEQGGFATAVDKSVMNLIVRSSGTLFLASIIIFIILNKNTKRILQDKIISYLYLVCLFALGCLHIKTGAFWRFEAIVVLFSPIIFIYLLEENKNFKKYMKAYFLFASILAVIHFYFMYKNIYFNKTVLTFISTSGLKILFEIIKGIISII